MMFCPSILYCMKWFVFFLFILTVAGCISTNVESPAIKVGLGETVITPGENVRMRGFARSQISTGIHDDLHARSLVLEGENGNTAVLMTVALCGMSEDYAKTIRAGITEKTGIPGDNIVISCTHTHAGPNVGSSHDTFNKEDVDESVASPEYRKHLVDQCVASAVLAWESRVPGRIGIKETTVMELGRNRRRLLYGGLHPDPEAAVIKIEDAAGKLLGVAFNYGCHPSALDWRNTLFSEDWPYYAIQGIKKEVGENVWVAYYQSAEGDINVGYSSELSAVGADMPIRNYEYIEIKGNQMADAVLKALPEISTSGRPEVDVTIDRFDYPLRDSYPVTLEQAKKDAEDAKTRLEHMEKIPEFQNTRLLDEAQVDFFQTDQRFRAAERFYKNEDRPATRSIEQQAVRIGDAVFVTYPGELFSEIALAIKQQSPLEKTFVIGVTCGPGGYLPSAKEFIEGDYEVNGSAYSPKTEQVCIDSSLTLIRRITD
ncbi:MAG: neutral/alkaline non-lysosomal ceramidase N-terminal domain-containing protein [Candidatus Latescibacteria bacterium]|nr:neutral/alkaline non-lysosomal ceramidase N-terminal domain-containing protein [Candidatus Latescibacterota bacterium]